MLDVALGKAGGAVAGKIFDSAANSTTGKLLDKAAGRAERIANNPKVGRPAARSRQAQSARANQQGFVAGADANSGAVGSNLATGINKIATTESE